MSQPVLMVVDDDESALRHVQGDLEKRYRTDYEVLAEGSAASALHRLAVPTHDIGDAVGVHQREDLRR